MKIRELYAHQDSSCGLGDRLVYCCGLACEGSAHYDLAISAIDAAGLLDQLANAYANRNIHEYMGLIAAVKLAAHGQVLGDAGLLLLDRFCDLGYSLQVHNYRSCCRRKLGGKKVDPQTLSYYCTLLAHRVDVCQEVHGDVRLVFQRRIQMLDGVVMFLLNCEDRLVCMSDLHTVFHAADHFIRLLYQLLDIVLQSRLTLCSIDQDIAVIQLKVCRKLRVDLRIQLCQRCLRQIDIQLYACGESGSAHSNDSCRLDHIQLGGICRYVDRYKLVRLLSRRLDDDPVVCDVHNLTIDTGEDICSQSRRCCDEGTFFYVIPNLYTWCTRSTHMLTQ